MIAIQTKYMPATNTRGSRIKAWTSNGHSVTVPYPHELSFEKAYFWAVRELVAKYNFDWNIKHMRYGAIDDGYVFCFDSSKVD